MKYIRKCSNVIMVLNHFYAKRIKKHTHFMKKITTSGTEAK